MKVLLMSLAIMHTNIHCFKRQIGTPCCIPGEQEFFYVAAAVPSTNLSKKVHGVCNQKCVLLTRSPQRLQPILSETKS